MEDPQRCVAERDLPTVSTSTENSGSGSNVDRVLFKNLVEMVPLVESLMDKRASSSFARRASIVHTRAPQLKRASDYKSKKVSQTDSIKKTRDAEESVLNDMNELLFLRDQVAELQKTLIEKEEALKSAESLTNQVNETYTSVGDLKRQVVEKDALIKSTNAQLYNAKIKLADKQAALEKIEWEAKMSKKKVEELEVDAISNYEQITTIMTFFEAIANKDPFPYLDDVSFEPPSHLDDMGEIDMVKMEEARKAYLLAVAAAKEDPSDESLAIAAEARLRLQSLVL